jgi:hypothetical protein
MDMENVMESKHRREKTCRFAPISVETGQNERENEGADGSICNSRRKTSKFA